MIVNGREIFPAMMTDLQRESLTTKESVELLLEEEGGRGEGGGRSRTAQLHYDARESVWEGKGGAVSGRRSE